MKRTQEANTVVTEKMNRDAAIGLYCRLNEIDWDQEKVEQTDHFERWYATVRAALSTDAEPDGWICEDEFTLEPDKAWEWEDRGLSPKPFYFSPQQNAEPVSGRNDEAGYVEFLNEDVPYIVRDIEGRCAILVDLHTRKYIGYRVYDPDSDFGSHASNTEPVEFEHQNYNCPCIHPSQCNETCVKTAPAVAVKPLRWKGPDSSGEYHSLDGLWGYIIRDGNGNGFWLTEIGDYFPSPEAAQEAAQADYDARILSALYAQVQDVAGLEDKIEGLEADLDNAIEVAFKRGATEWVRLNYPKHYERFSASPASKHGDAE